MSIAIYGKTMENLRKKIDVRLISNKKHYLKWISKPSYMLHKLYDNGLIAMCKSKVTLTVNKPAYIGMCILELSKVLMYEFHYDHIKYKYDNKLRLLFTDTGSLTYETEDVYEDFGSNQELFDFSNYLTKPKY